MVDLVSRLDAYIRRHWRTCGHNGVFSSSEGARLDTEIDLEVLTNFILISSGET